MDEMNFLCKNCGHSFKFHQQSTFDLWYCDVDGACECNYFERKRESGKPGDEILAQYDSDTYRWN